MIRQSTIERKTQETDIRLVWSLEGHGDSRIQTGIPFMDHMLTLFARHGLFDITLQCQGDLEVDAHHTMEDLGLVMGSALREALGDKRGITRYGHMILPMDESLVLVALDCSGRAFLQWDVCPPTPTVAHLDAALFREFFRAFCTNAGLNLHVQLLKSEEGHHAFEAIFKGFARALSQAVAIDPRVEGVPSTKGTLDT